LPVAIDPAEWISQAEAARLRSVTRQAVAKLVGSGRLRTVVIGGRTLVSRADVMAFEPLPAGRPKGAARE
jgi:excisionase family DNA binding protein